MDELKDFIDIRIATRCPLCGKRFKKLTIELHEHTPVWINSQCDCGLSLELDNSDRTDILDEWNEVSSK